MAPPPVRVGTVVSVFALIVALVVAPFAFMGFAAFLRDPPPPPAPLVAGLGIVLANDSISVDESSEPFQQAAAIAEISGFSISSPAVVTITGISNGTNNLVEVLGDTILSPGAMNFVQPIAGHLQYTGTRDVFCHTAVTLTMSCVSADQTFVMMLGINGIPQTNSIILQHIATGGDIESAALHSYVRLRQNDYLSLFVGNIISISDYNLYSANGFAMCMYM